MDYLILTRQLKGITMREAAFLILVYVAETPCIYTQGVNLIKTNYNIICISNLVE